MSREIVPVNNFVNYHGSPSIIPDCLDRLVRLIFYRKKTYVVYSCSKNIIPGMLVLVG